MSLQTNISNAYGKSVETKINLEKEFIPGEMKNKNAWKWLKVSIVRIIYKVSYSYKK